MCTPCWRPRAGQLRGVTTDDLQRYDDNIREHLKVMNAGRAEPITLRYFQYLAALYAEMYLDRYCGDSGALLRSLNEFVVHHNANCALDERYDYFTAADLDKMAFWMATGQRQDAVVASELPAVFYATTSSTIGSRWTTSCWLHQMKG